MSTVRTNQSNPVDAWRIILVGRTGLDQSLRRCADIELIRARDTFDAIGELSDPIDHESPVRAAVIVAQDTLADETEADGFVRGLRLVDPGVRVLTVDDDFDACDGCVGGHDSGDAVIEAVRNAEPRSVVVTRPVPRPEPVQPEPAVPEPEPIVEADDEPTERAESNAHLHAISSTANEPLTTSPNLSRGPMNDQLVIEALISGQPITPAAISLIRARTGRDDIDFVQGASGDGVPVRLGRSTIGMLVCDDERWAGGPGGGELSMHAAWLGKWIKLETQHTELRHAAFTDSLTGAWNRRYFTRFLDAAIEQSRSVRQPLTVLYFDIDGFKQYNDRYGHAAGDEILVETVRLMQSVIRPSDRVCRVGGDEFVVIFYEPHGPRDPSSKPPESIYSIARRFQQQICTHGFPKLGTEAPSTLTISGGLASFPWDGADAESLLERADQLAMDSKRQGKNAITLGPGAESVCRINPER
ncbi:MAG: GGDEF domain-containing protein [Phycisphaerales bacterium]|nr:GGDEF domain-containing protein [Phycisphaerales bacterium]